jgi:UDP-hydrolysing UDP-N-acetyl-D-glucosamine 2-epimerase
VLSHLSSDVQSVLLLGNSIYFYKYGYAYQNIKQDFPEIPIYRVTMAAEGDSLMKMPQSVGMGCIEIPPILERVKPDAVLTVADRYETAGTAISASFMNVPLIHLQGGEVSGTVDDDVRNMITQLADYHFPATDDAADRIMQMKPKDHARIWNMGCPSMDLIRRPIPYYFLNEVNKHGHGDDIDICKSFIIVMLHPDTKGSYVDVELLMDVLNKFPEQKLIFWPNIDPSNDRIAKAWRMGQEGYWNSPVRYVRHLDQHLFGHLLVMADCIIGNSSAGIREATFTGTPSITIGDRQKGRECGPNVMRVPFEELSLMNALIKQLDSSYVPNNMYGDGHAGEKIAKKLGEILEG